MKSLTCLLALLAVFALAFGDAPKVKIEKLDDLPRHLYKIDVKAAELLDNDAALLKLAKEVEANLKADLDKFDIQDKTTLKGMWADLGSIALIEGRYDDYLKGLELRKSLEDKEASRYTTGLFMRAFIAAKQSGDTDFAGALKRELEKLVKDLPYEVCEANLKSAKGSAEIVSKDLLVGQINSAIQPTLDGSKGEMSQDIATGLLSQAVSARNLIPYKQVIVEVYSAWIDAHATALKPDIWEARDVTLTPQEGKDPVVVGVWDSGVDVEIFLPKQQVWTNSREVADNNKDDDGNGYIDDVHGIAYSLHSEKEIPLLYNVGDVSQDRPRLQRLIKGFSDLQSSVDSEESQELKVMMSKLPADSVKPFIEGIAKYGNYSHGTHVAGIAAKGNPFVRLLTSRITFDYHMIPETPTKELARAEAKANAEAIAYFKQNGVRVVNMSWGGSLRSVEEALEQNNAGGSVDERKQLAREIFEISKDGLFEAMKGAPEILFVVSAGNSNSDNEFEEFMPSSFVLPNMLTVGAVDQAGDETSFTSFGKTEVYANGFEVLSYVPGGDQIKYNGTSMSSPNVTNLAAKLLARNAKLNPTQLRELIINGSEERKSGDRIFRLINPRRSMELLAAGK
ncbi:S8 family serine peptidase [candidate division KSB1 bacterium]|nr:S8 family serine peptidase [candidate division KSB1 bacterium]